MFNCQEDVIVAGYPFRIGLSQPLNSRLLLEQVNWCYSNSIDAYFTRQSVSFMTSESAVIYRLKWGIR